MRLNMWHRFGIVASVLWFIGGGIWQLESDNRTAQSFMNLDYRLCTDAKAHKGDFNFHPCMKKASASRKLMMEGSGANALFMAIVPIIFGWLFTYLVIWIVRWVLRGRSAEDG